MLRLTFFTALLVAFLASSGQASRVSGILLDSKTNEPIPFAHIVANGSGVITDFNGKFDISLEEDETAQIRITCVGYKSKQLVITEKSEQLRIALEPEIVSLETITVTGERETAENVVKEAISRIRTNYTFRFNHVGYLKESEHYANNDPMYIIHAYLDAEKVKTDEGYKTVVKLIKGSTQEFELLSKMDFITNSAYSMYLSTAVSNPPEFLSLDKIHKYQFEYESFTYLDGVPIAIIKFQEKRGRAYRGKLTIDLNDYAFVKVEAFKKHGPGMPTDNWKWRYKSYYDQFTKNSDGKWVLLCSSFIGDWIRKKTKKSYQTRVFYLVTDIENVISYNDEKVLIPKGVDMHDFIPDYDPLFWQGFNQIDITDFENEMVERVKKNAIY